MERSVSDASSTDLVTSTDSFTPAAPAANRLDKFKNVLAIVTVEPVLFLYMLATFMQYSVFQDLVYQKTCQSNFNSSVCQNLNNNSYALDVVQEQASHWILGSTAALTIPSIIVANYLGSYSDLYDRKWPLLFPACGMVLASIVYILMSLYDSIPVSMIVLASFLSGIFGGFVSCIMSVMSYISAVTSEESRSLRVAMLEAMTFCGGTVGPFIGGALLGATQSHAAVFLVIMAFYVLVILYVIFLVPSVKDDRSADEQLILTSENYCRKLFSCHHFQSSLQTCFKPRPNNRRRNLLLLIACALITMTVTAGEMDVAYLFTKDDPLNWSYETYSYYFGLKFGVGALSLIALSPVVRRLNLQEAITCCIGLVSKAAGLVLHGFATTNAMMFCVPFLSMFNTFCLPSIRSLLSKQVDPNELGKLFAFVASIENICTLLGSIVFNILYPLTRSIFRGFTFELAAIMLIIPLVIMSYLSYQMKRELYYVSTAAARRSDTSA
ncbi:proton-coupled folate transporter-like [Daphnia pulex]|uniref:proton-coupled folate transporter-like n=1 Tax=Daphnia pulex TaxID=6669 RepID=UPI001EDF55C7|nr:proton-coupled folate transporter-like [Daphnia pulex]